MTGTPLMPPAEVAKYLRVDLRTLQRWARAGIGPRPIRLGPRIVRYHPRDVEDWLGQQGGAGITPKNSGAGLRLTETRCPSQAVTGPRGPRRGGANAA